MDSAARLMDYLCTSDATETERISFLASLISKGVEAQEIAGFAKSLRTKSSLPGIRGCTDIVGTGGDGMQTFNVSTCAAIVSSAMGVRIAKHGNRAVTGIMGSADFLSRIGYNFGMPADQANSLLEETGFIFILAPMYNSAFSVFRRSRKLIGTKTVFNLLGPLTNPVDPDISIIGCSPELADLYAGALTSLGKRGAVVSSSDGMDEISPFAEGKIILVGDTADTITINGPELAGITSRENVCSPDPGRLYDLALSGLSGENQDALRFIALNSAPSLMMNGLADSFEEGYYKSMDCILEGRAMSRLEMISRRMVNVKTGRI